MSRNTNLKRVLDDAEGSSRSTPKRTKTITNLFNPNNVLTFACNNTSLNIVWEENDHQRNIKCFEAASKAYHNYNRHFKIVGFDESMKKAKQFLSLHGILPAKNLNGNEKIVSTNFDTNLINECFQITDLLRRKPMPLYMILHYIDSFLPQNYCWEPLRFSNEPEDAAIKQNVFFEKITNRFDDSEYTATIKSNTENNPQPQAPRTNTKEFLTDEALLQRVTTAIHIIISRRFQDKKKRNANLTINQFIDEQLSSSGSSLPLFIPALQKSLEREMTEEERPQSRSWLSNRWSRLKRNKNYDLQYFLDGFKEQFHQEDYNITTQTEE
jgi:hypothetical protein